MRASQFARLLVPICMCANFANADWQYTRWGMTEQEVVAASNGAVASVAPRSAYKDGSSMRVEGTYDSDVGKFEATFIFDKDGHLYQVNLGQLDAESCANTRRLLTEKYGPASAPEPRVSVWRDEKSGNIINWSDNSVLHSLMPAKNPGCYVTYKAMKTSNAGL